MDKIEFDAIPNALEFETKFINELANGNGGIIRRIAYAVLFRSSDYFYNEPMSEETGEVFFSQLEPLSDYISLMKSHIELMEVAQARLFAVLGYHFE